MTNKQQHFASTAIIAGLYREVPLDTRIFNKALMLPSLACRVDLGGTRGVYMYLHDKYETRNQAGELRHMERIITKLCRCR